MLGLENLLDDDSGGGPDAEAQRLLEEREQARAERDFARADALRDELAARGWEVRDTPEGAAARARLILYGRNPVREALRGSRRAVQRVWATEAARRSEDWLAEAAELHTADAA